MKSVKPGRGPSMMGGVMSIFMGLFGLLWTILVASSGGGIFALSGVISSLSPGAMRYTSFLISIRSSALPLFSM